MAKRKSCFGACVAVVTFGVVVACSSQVPRAAGDSGAVWVETESRAPVALHYSAQSGGRGVAYAIPMPAVLRALQFL